MKTRTSHAACLGAAANLSYVFRGLFCLGALLVSSFSAGQSWPVRYDEAGGDDQAVAMTVDHRGNVIVVGTVTSSRGDKDAFCISYNTSGGMNWRQWYDHVESSAHGDDYGTGVAVDWEGNVYMCGVSYGGSTRHNDFFVIKLEPALGHTVWPNSGSRTGCDFDNGAIRLSDNNDDGFDADGNAICSISMQDGSGSQPTFAIAGPTQSGSNFRKWRVVEFVADATDGVKVKAGWPYDIYGANHDDIPRACANRALV